MPSSVIELISGNTIGYLHRLTVKGDVPVINDPGVLSEKALIASARAGSRSAFGELVRRHSNRVYGMSFRMLKNREDAEDNLQNAFCKAYGKIGQFEGHSQFSTWLMRIAINEALMMIRKRRPGNLATSDTDSESNDHEAASQVRDSRPDPEREYSTKELTTKALDALHPALKYTFILQKGEGWTCQELANALDITPETVKSRIFRSRARLRQQIMVLTKTPSVALQNYS